MPTLRIAGLAFAVMVVLLIGMRLARSGALQGVHLGGQNVSGMSATQLHDVVRTLAQQRAKATVTVVRAPVPEAGALQESRLEVTGAELGYTLDVDATVKRVLRRGRQLNPFAAFTDQIRAFGGTMRVLPVQEVAEATFAPWLDDAVRKLRVEPIEGSLAFEGTTIARVAPKAGAAVSPEALRRDVLFALFHGETQPVQAQVEPIKPLTTMAQVEALERDAQQALSAPIQLRREDVTVTLLQADIAQILEVERVTKNDTVGLELSVSPERLREVIGDEVLATIEQEPVDASFAISGNSVRVVDAKDGFAFDAEAAAEQVVTLLQDDGARAAELTGIVTAPKLSTEDAAGLGITEQVSTFTTNHPCCQGRVKNIQQAAKILDGTIVKPGQTFSLNDTLGERTVAKGFTNGGAIFDGEFVEQIGGGVSQLATTTFNAAFFGGYAIPAHKPHSYYISRYPVGREATLNWRSVDLKVHNNSPHGLLIKTSFTGTSITVTFYGTKWVTVSESTGPRTNVTPPGVRYKENPALPPGTEKVVSEGREGFDIMVIRTLTFPNGKSEKERFFTRYLAEPRTIERNSATPDPNATESPSASPSPSPSASDAPAQ